MDRVVLLRRRFFGIDPGETTFERRGFWDGDPAAVAQLEHAGASFVLGYHTALEVRDADRLGAALDGIEPAWRGFAFEGVGMALALLDGLTPWNRERLAGFLAGPGDAHAYMVTIGAGWAWARLGGFFAPVDRELRRLDPILGWLALDGFGFHEGYFAPQRTIDRQTRPRQVAGHAAKIFDAGVGRSLWFVCGADPERVAARIGRFDPGRHADLWAGVGLASTYACGVSGAVVDRLVALCGAHRGSLAQGAAFAAKARERAGNPVPHTEMAVSRICSSAPELAAKLCDTELANATADHLAAGSKTARSVFERWRTGVRQTFERSFAAASP